MTASQKLNPGLNQDMIAALATSDSLAHAVCDELGSPGTSASRPSPTPESMGLLGGGAVRGRPE
eukprot:2098719-Pyramimonas_sp.AAC.1